MNLSAPDSVLFIYLFISSGFSLSLCCKTEQQPELRGRRDSCSRTRALKRKKRKRKEEFFEDDKEFSCRGSAGITAVNLDSVYGSLDREKNLHDGFTLRCGPDGPVDVFLGRRKT